MGSEKSLWSSVFSWFSRRQKSSLCRKKMKDQPNKERLPHSSARDKKKWRLKASQSRPLRLNDGSDRWALKDALQKKKISEHQGLSFFFPRYETNPGNRLLSEHHLTHQLFFSCFSFNFEKQKQFFLFEKRPHSFAHSCVPQVCHCNPPEKHFTNHWWQNDFLFIEKKRKKKGLISSIHSFNCLIILPVNVISPCF